jgi:hypothetical protein
MRLSKLLLAAMTVTVVFGALATTASARSFENSNQGVRAAFSRVRFEGLFGEATCAVTLEGSLHARNQAKTVGSLIGYINRAILGPCAVGTATILTATLPWHTTYAGFSGTLPNITQIRTNVINSSFRIRTNTGETCLARSTTSSPMTATYNIGAGGVIASATIGGTIPTGAECFGFPVMLRSDAGLVTPTGSSTRITVRLI